MIMIINIIMSIYNCDTCKYSTDNEKVFKNHKKTKKHLGIPYEYKKYIWKCEACDKILESKTLLKKHVYDQSHYKNVVNKYPECLLNPIYINRTIINRPRINIKKRNAYIKMMTIMREKKKAIQGKKNKGEMKEKIIKINIDDYLEPDDLDSQEKKN